MSDSESEIDEEKYPYQLVGFEPNKKSAKKGLDDIDCVPTKWVSFDPKIGKVTARFAPPPYTTESCNLLHRLMQKRSDAPDSFPAYPARLRGEAKSWKEALLRLKQLNEKEYVYTSDSEVPEEKAKRHEKRFEKRSLKELMEVPSINSENPASGDRSCSTRVSTKVGKPSFTANKKKSGVSATWKKTNQQLSTKPLLREMSNSEVQDKSDSDGSRNSSLDMTHRDVSSKMAHHDIPKKAHNDFRSSSSSMNVTICKDVPSKMAYGDTQKRAQVDFQDSASETSSMRQKYLAPSVNMIHKKNENSASSKKPKCSEETIVILKAIKDLETKMEGLVDKLCHVVQNLGYLRPAIGSMCNFVENHELEIPISSIDEFQDFDAKLKNDSGFHESFKASLRFLLNSDHNIGKSITNILKKYMSRSVATQYTAVKQTRSKLIFKNTTFICCIKDVITSNHLDKKGNPVTLEALYHSLGTSLANAKDWEGHRKKRAKRSKQQEHNELDHSSDSGSAGH